MDRRQTCAWVLVICCSAAAALAQPTFKERASTTRTRLKAAREGALGDSWKASATAIEAKAGAWWSVSGSVGLATVVSKGRVRPHLVLSGAVGDGVGAYVGVAARDWMRWSGARGTTIPAQERNISEHAAFGVGFGGTRATVMDAAGDGAITISGQSMGVGAGLFLHGWPRNVVVPLPLSWRSKALRRSERGLALVGRAEAAEAAGKFGKAERLLHKADGQLDAPQ
jgi:hypothetical protein